MTTITIYHNPKCGTSRNTLAMIRNSGVEPEVIEYLKAPPDHATLVALIAATGEPVIKLPTTALHQANGGSAVWVFDAATSTVRSQPVVVATADGNEIVIAQGLTPGMRVVATGGHVLAPGQKVTVYQSPVEAARAAPAAKVPPAGAAPAGAAPAAQPTPATR